MKKLNINPILGFVMLGLFTSCNKDNELEIKNTSQKVYSFENEYEAHIFYDNLLKQEQPELFLFNDPRSELWPENKNRKSKSTAANGVITVTGYTSKTLIQNRTTSFFDPNPPLVAGVTYMSSLYYYNYRVAIPTGSAISIPPPEIMSTLPNQGWHPDNSRLRGYSYKFIESKNGLDYYDLYTKIEDISHDISGRLLFDPPLHLPGYISAENITWKYQYVNW